MATDLARRKVFATGASLITPLGRTKEQTWQAILEGKSGVRKLSDMTGKCQIGSRLPDYQDFPETSMNSRIHSFSEALAIDCIKDAGIDFEDYPPRTKWRTGCIVANQYGVQEIAPLEAGSLRLIKQMPHSIPSALAMKYQLQGHISAPSGASVGGMIGMGEAFRLIRDGYADRMLVGGLDYNCNQNVIPGMDAFGALCTSYNDDPENACKPMDKNRAGTVLGDGGGMILLESQESAEARGANILCEIAGYGQTNDASNLMRPLVDGLGLVKAIHKALAIGRVHPSEISAFNCHARSTIVGDDAEVAGIRALLASSLVFPTLEEFLAQTPERIVECYLDPLPEKQPIMSGQKGNLGHTVAAAGVVESVLTMLCIKHQKLPKIKGLSDPLEPNLHYAMENTDLEINSVVKNGFVFGGINCAMLFKKV